MSKSNWVTTRQLETLAGAVNAFYSSRTRCDPAARRLWGPWRDDLIRRVHRMMKPAVRPYAGQVVTDVAIGLVAELNRAWHRADDLDQMTYQLNGELMFVRQQLVNLRREQEQTTVRIETLQSELAQARANLARRPAATSLVLPAQKITVESGIQREILRLMAVEGLGRVWRIVERVLADGLTGNANTVRNAVSRLVERELLADYEQHGKPVSWTYKAGGTRRLVQLTPTDRGGRAAAQVGEPRHRRAGDCPSPGRSRLRGRDRAGRASGR